MTWSRSGGHWTGSASGRSKRTRYHTATELCCCVLRSSAFLLNEGVSLATRMLRLVRSAQPSSPHSAILAEGSGEIIRLFPTGGGPSPRPQPLHVIASGVASKKPVVLTSKGGHFSTLRELTECMRASMLLPGITGPMVGGDLCGIFP